MRLIDVKTLELFEFHHSIPPYAILSHTWGDQEVTFQDYLLVTNHSSSPCTHNSSRAGDIKRKTGFAKILGACSRARADGLAYLWCDTNCIDKSSSAELTEAINSMYAWYRDSVICYAYLSDVGVVDCTGRSDKEFKKSRWFTRGWTLQELLAPEQVFFFNINWLFIADRQRLAEVICGITRIHKGALKDRSTIQDYSIAQRMSWAADRHTSRQEDIAYCLFGIFDINMPLLYGEGMKAFTRLQEEIIKVSNDQSIFAWDFACGQEQSLIGILAPSPNEFALCGSIVRDLTIKPWPYSTTNIGVSLRLPLIQTCVNETVLVRLNCSVVLQEYKSHKDTQAVELLRWKFHVWIWLRLIGDDIYTRSPNPISRTFLTDLYPDKLGYVVSEFYGATGASTAQRWVSSLFSATHSNHAASTGFHITMSFGRIRERTSTFQSAFPPGDFTVYQIPPRGIPALSHEIVSAGNYVVILSIIWNQQHVPRHRHSTVFWSANGNTIRVMSASNWHILFEHPCGSHAEQDNDAKRIEHIYEQIRKLSHQPSMTMENSLRPFVNMERSLWQDCNGQTKVVAHLTFQELTKPEHVA